MEIITKAQISFVQAACIRFTSYLVALCSHKIRQSIENPDYHHHELQHNHRRSCHDFQLQMTGISMQLDNPLQRLFAKCILCLANIPVDSWEIRVGFHFPKSNRHHKPLFKTFELILIRIYCKWNREDKNGDHDKW